MPNKDTPYQTLGEFLRSPFGSTEVQNTTELDTKYEALKRAKKIYCENYSIVDGSYLFHIKIPSESQQGLFYDVVIQFFTEDPSVGNQLNISHYFIQFYSNSPSFIYKYAALYKVHGYLIDSLYDKMDTEYSHMLPDKANPDYKMTYDKSIYFACRFLKDNEMTILRKTGILFFKKVDFRKMLKSIKDYETVQADSELRKMEDSLKKETAKEKAEAKEKRRDFINKINPFHKNETKQKKKTATRNTSQDGVSSVTVNQKKRSVRSTDPKHSNVKVISKKKAGFSTRKK